MIERAVERLDGSVDSLLRRITDLEKRLHRIEADHERLKREHVWATRGQGVPLQPHLQVVEIK